MLSRCISVDRATFGRENWGRLPLLSSSESLPRGFDDLLSESDVDELIARRGLRTPFIRMARDGGLVGRECYTGPAGFGAEMPDQVDSAQVLAQFAAGATIVLQGLHRLWPPVIDFVRGMVDDLGHPVQANAYVTPAGNRGFDPHYDVHDVFILQTAGHKRWTVHEPVYRDPLVSQPWTDHRAAIEARVGDDPVIDTVLAPGDALYLPRGWIHSALAQGDTSIHLTIGVAATTVGDVVRAVVDELAGVEEFRSSLPMAIDLTDRDETEAMATKAMAALVAVLRDRSTELGDATTARLRARFAEQTRPAAVWPLRTAAVIDDLDATVAVRWRHGLVGTVRRAADRVELRLRDRTISFPGYCADALNAVAHREIVSAGALPGLDAADGMVLIRRLLREAVVVPAEMSTGSPA
ncbi:cupin [Gordonia sp. SID5947]|uniref:cupin domain-containing protein n=1 Tax=Gordonia sp. SID5947 TaxID=2690315 RepID=UPI00136C3099|nr:cupin domain-containing protein [Gordonia sp. SID5947]MYR05289.1 cupin [Gordonia sp. SID5947]